MKLFLALAVNLVMLILFNGRLLGAELPKLSLDPNPPDVGNNTLTIELLNAEGAPEDAESVNLLFYMPAMSTMPYMETPATVEKIGAGTFEASYELSMGGTWEATLKVNTGTQEKTYRYSITTGIPGIADKNRSAEGDSSGETNLIDVGADRLQLIGVRFAEAKRQELTKMIRAVGVVEQDETHREEVSMRVSGYLVKQFRGRVGDYIKKGEPLFTIYSPDLVTAQSEFLLATKFAEGKTGALGATYEDRLKNLGLSANAIAEIKKTGKTIRDVVVRSPISGTILDIRAREGASVGAGQILYVIGDLSQTYIVARVFQQDVGDLSVGQAVEVVVPDRGETYAARVDLIYPQVEQGAGTANVRVEVSEYAPELRPGTYVDLRFPVDLGEHLVIPSEAVLYSGLYRYVFVDRGGGHLEPLEIVTGRRADSLVSVREGISVGDRVVASGTFLLSSEAQLRSALPKWKTKPEDSEEVKGEGQ